MNHQSALNDHTDDTATHLDQLRTLVQQQGELPGRPTVMRRLGIGESRARQLIRQLRQEHEQHQEPPSQLAAVRQLPTSHQPTSTGATGRQAGTRQPPAHQQAGDQHKTHDTQSDSHPAEPDSPAETASTGASGQQAGASLRATLHRLANSAPIWLPVAAVLAMAWHGQFLFARDQLALDTPVAAAIGAFLELLMFGTNQRAHERRRAGDRTLPLRTFAIVCAALASLMNYAHFAGPDLTPTQQAVTYGFASVLGFTYWELVANARIRADHIAAGLRTPPRPIVTTGPGPRLSAPRLIARTLLHPIRTARAVDTSLTNPHLSPTQAWDASKQRDAVR